MQDDRRIPMQEIPDAGLLQRLRGELDHWGQEAGFDEIRVTDIDLSARRPHLEEWLERGFHGEMGWMRDSLEMRLAPERLQPGTLRVISARMDYGPEQPVAVAADRAYVSVYARGRDYHKLLRRRLARIADQLREWCTSHRFRALVDSAPALEKPLAEKAGLGWMGKHTVLIHREAGSWFFLGEIFTSLPLPVDAPTEREWCGGCQACMDACPTGAIVAPWRLDARRCISYLTIEHPGPIPLELRPLSGNRIFGCDDCQLVCPWNRRAVPAREAAFLPRPEWIAPTLGALFRWDEDTWDQRTRGSPLRRTGYERWRRNLAVALGNAPADPDILAQLIARRGLESELVNEHVEWAIDEQRCKLARTGDGAEAKQSRA